MGETNLPVKESSRSFRKFLFTKSVTLCIETSSRIGLPLRVVVLLLKMEAPDERAWTGINPSLTILSRSSLGDLRRVSRVKPVIFLFVSGNAILPRPLAFPAIAAVRNVGFNS